MIVGVVLFYILQNREVNRFFQQQDLIKREQVAVKKEQQLRNILNQHSDAIMVVGSD